MRLNSGGNATSAKLALLVHDDLSATINACHHQPLCTWVRCLYLMGLNISNHQIGQELNLNKDDIQQMTTQLRSGIVVKKPKVRLTGEVEFVHNAKEAGAWLCFQPSLSVFSRRSLESILSSFK